MLQPLLCASQSARCWHIADGEARRPAPYSLGAEAWSSAMSSFCISIIVACIPFCDSMRASFRAWITDSPTFAGPPASAPSDTTTSNGEPCPSYLAVTPPLVDSCVIASSLFCILSRYCMASLISSSAIPGMPPAAPPAAAGGWEGGVGSTGDWSAPPKSIRGDGADGRTRVVQTRGVDGTENDEARARKPSMAILMVITITLR
mmetsp:Transcript_16106/g.33658  ORF Transcript_16106/g.33658 Transcript_16106/m.33658 type:complete len:204 (+) Transcript_16106:288-899(+)